ncbi:MAG: right-handed parallel beta-helix repeat-containing protein [Thermoanaerobaculia bacterium]
MRRNHVRASSFIQVLPFLSVVFVLAVTPALGAKPSDPGSKTITVDCTKGQSVNEALADRTPSLTITLSGVCTEDVLITRDDVTIEGTGAIVGAAGGAPDAVTIRGASRVTLRGLTIQSNEGRGVRSEGSQVTLESMHLDGSFRDGLLAVSGSEILFSSGTADDNGGEGIGVWETSTIRLAGTTSTSRNGRVGILISEGSSLTASGSIAGSLTADDNLYGILLQVGGAALTAVGMQNGGFPISASGNTEVGVSLEVGGVWAGANSLMVANSPYGVYIYGSVFTQASFLPASAFTVTGCEYGLVAEQNSTLLIKGTITGNTSQGVALDTSTAVIRQSVIQDVGVSFGSRLRFGSGNTIGPVSCESTVIVRGAPGCDPQATIATDAASATLGRDPATRAKREIRIRDRIPKALTP